MWLDFGRINLGIGAYLNVGEHDFVGDLLDVLLNDFGLIFVLQTEGQVIDCLLLGLLLGLG